MRRVAIPGAIAQSVVATVLGALLAHAFGWGWSAGIVFGMALAVASTVVLIRVLADNNDLHTPGRPHRRRLAGGRGPVHRRRAGAAAGAVRRHGAAAEPLWSRSADRRVKVGGAGRRSRSSSATRVIPRLLDYVAATRSRELFTLTVLVMALGIAVGSALSLRRLDGAGRVPRRHGRRPVRVTACAPRPRRCRCATRSRCCSSSRSACCSIPRALLESPRPDRRRRWRSSWSASRWSR